MRCQFEHVTFPKGCSIRIYHRQVASIPFEWHHHPVYELTLTLNSRGWRFIADHIAHYDAHDLVLVPSDMPHTWASTAAINESLPHTALVVWFTREWALKAADACREIAPLRKLINRSGAGLRFPVEAAARMESRLPELLSESPLKRLHATQELLCELADTPAMPLATQTATRPELSSESRQLVRVLERLHQNFDHPIRLDELCKLANLSARSLHRLFVRHIGENFSDYLGRLRIGRACMLLVETERPISVIASETGFSNLSNFNRRFRQARHMTPKEFRRFAAEHGRMPDSEPGTDLNKRSPSLEHPIRRPVPDASLVRELSR
ncbi:MAG TPA: AraC family transcriptional regulator [Terriglobales bacterium]|nr:AraC family transcriptional regulator [Terriglobales bacterium]